MVKDWENEMLNGFCFYKCCVGGKVGYFVCNKVYLICGKICVKCGVKGYW